MTPVLCASTDETVSLFGAPASCQLVARWVDPTTARRYLEQNQMRPSWTHFVPQLGKTRNGICFDMMTTSSWRGDRSIGFLLRPQDLPQPQNAYAFEGHRTFCLQSRLHWTLDRDLLQKELASVQANLRDYIGRPDELFVTHTVDKLGERLRGIVLLAGLQAPVFDVEVREFAQRFNVPLLELSKDEFFEARYRKGGLGGLLPAAGASKSARTNQAYLSALAPARPKRMTRLAKSYQAKRPAAAPYRAPVQREAFAISDCA